MDNLNPVDSSADQASLTVPQIPMISQASEASAPEANVLDQMGLIAADPLAFMLPQMLQMQQMQMFMLPQMLQMQHLQQMQLMAQASQASPGGANHVHQQSHHPQSTPRRAYLKRKRETPTPKRQAATPAQARSEPIEALPEVNFNDPSAYERLLSSVWDFKGDTPWSHYSVQQVAAPLHHNLSTHHTTAAQ
jgi:hypothetical protein